MRVLRSHLAQARAALPAAALAVALLAGSCGSPAKKSGTPPAQGTAPTTPPASGPASNAPSAGVPTTVAQVRTVALPSAPCTMLSDSDLAGLLPGSVPIARTTIQSGSISRAGCSWRWGSSSVDVEITKYLGGDPYSLAAKLMKNPQPVSGLGGEAIESDNRAANPHVNRIIVLVRVGDAAVEVTAQIAGQVIVGFVEAVAHTVVVHL